MTSTYKDLRKVNELLMEQEIRIPTLVFSLEQVEMLKKEDKIRTDKDGRMWIQNWYPGVNGVEVFQTDNLEPGTMVYIKDKEALWPKKIQ